MRNRLILISGFFIILLALFYYFFLIWRVSNTSAEQILNKQELAAKAGSITISTFIEILGFQTSVFATGTSIITPNPQDTPQALKNLVEGMQATPMVGAILTDAQGTVLYGYEKQGTFAGGENISDREHFKWAEGAKSGEIYVGTPVISRLGFSEGSYIVPIGTPVIKEGKFNGVFATAFFVGALTNQYLNELRTDNNTRIYIIDNQGVMISSPTAELRGVNYFEYLKSLDIDSDNIDQTFRSALASDRSGTIDISLPDLSKNGALTRFFIGYAPIRVDDDTRWLLAIATPASDALASLYPLYFRDLGITGLVALVSITIALYLQKMLGILGKGSKAPKDKKEIPSSS